MNFQDLREYVVGDNIKDIAVTDEFRNRLRFLVPVFLEIIKALELVHLQTESKIQRSVYIVDLIALNL